MYQFSNSHIAGLVVSQTFARQGTDHKKRYTVAGVTPVTQDTLNVYAYGSFSFEVGSFSQTLSAGQTSMDLTIAEYPQDAICTETVLSPWGARFCVSAKQPWNRQFHTLAVGQELEVAKDSLLIVMTGAVSFGVDSINGVSFRLFQRGVKATATQPSSLIVCALN